MTQSQVLVETLNGVGKNGIGIAETKSAITKMLGRTINFQIQIRKHIDEDYVEFMPNHTSPDMFLEKSGALIDEIGELLGSVGNEGFDAVNKANAELANSARELREITLGLHVSQHILKVDDLFQCLEEAKSTNDCLVVLDLLSKLRGLIYPDKNSDVMTPDVKRIFQALECYETIKVKYQVQSHLLQQNLQERFDRLVQLNCKAFPTSKCVTLLISKDEAQLQDIVIALFQERYNPASLCTFLLEHCFEPLILKPVSVEYNDNAKDGTHIQLTLSYSIKEQDTSTLLRPNYKDVFEHFRQLLQTLSSINSSVSGTQHVFTIIGNQVKARLLKLLVEECLIPSVPETMEEYQSSTLCDDVVHFEHFLADMFFINPEQDSALNQFTRKYDTYFRNALCKRVLETAREIIQRDLQDMTLVAANNTSSNVANNPFLLPRCMISKSVQEFGKLLDRILRQPTESCNDNQPEPLSGIINQLIETYINEVPKVHKKLLQSIPQQSALFHNNCLYLTRWVAHQGNKSIDSNPSQVKMLQTAANKILRHQIDYQESILVDIMTGFELESAHTLGTAPLSLVRQCLRQLELLKNVWQQVLPDTVYNSTFCELINLFTKELVRRVLKLRDISATMATELSDLIDVVLEKAPLLFQDKNEVVKVLTWQKLQQLKTLMNASLKEFTELWCDGVGPLTANYQANEIKHLIQALFQDTDRRAQAIIKII